MNNNLDILKQGQCINDSDLLKYVDGVLTAEQKREVELHLAGCSMCSDAVDGLLLMRKENRQAVLQNISKLVNERVKAEVKIIPFYKRFALPLSAAAALIVVSVILFLLINNSEKNNMAVLKQATEQKSVPVVKPEAAPVAKDTFFSTVNQNAQQKEVEMQEVHEDLNAIKTVSETDNLNAAVAGSVDVVSADEAAAGIADREYNFFNKNPADADKKLYDTAIAETATEYKMLEKSDKIELSEVTVASKSLKRSAKNKSAVNSLAVAPQSAESELKKDSENNSYSQAISLYNDKKYTEALVYFEQLLNCNTKHAGYNYYAAMCHFNLKNYKEALNNFKYSTRETNSGFYESALYHQALCNVELNKTSDAVKLLRKVVDLNGNYKVQSSELLKQLEGK